MKLSIPPFIDLHLHLDGSLSSEVILDIAKNEGIDLPTYDQDELDKLLRCPINCTSLNDYLRCFSLPNLVLQTPFGLKTALKDLLRRLSNDDVKYVEVRMAPQLSTLKGLSQEEVVAILVNTMKECEKEYGIISNLILSMMRGNDTHINNIETIEVAKKYQNNKVVAVDLAGAEALYPNELFESEFNLINKYDLNLIIHAGEASDYKSVLSAIKYGAKRIGHGVRSIEDNFTLNLIKEKGIYLEICPKSNLDTRVFNSYLELPIKSMLDMGIKVTINTDNLTVSSTSLCSEFNHIKTLNLTSEDYKTLLNNSIDASFTSTEEKEILRKYLK